MRSAHQRVGAAVIRAAAADHVQRKSLRGVAREIGTNAPALRQFLDGAHPREKTLRKLREWYFDKASDRTGEISLDTARSAIDMLVEPLAEQERPAVTRRVLDLIITEHRDDGTPPPTWLATLAGQSEPEIGVEQRQPQDAAGSGPAQRT